ncbi:hypothetical protein, partial [Mesorhizobium sp.]|uniref:hypothetical protein n=1 Tax=Mesorhizobium sp. TaxID=1871066 RepID=UPI0025BE3860
MKRGANRAFFLCCVDPLASRFHVQSRALFQERHVESVSAPSKIPSPCDGTNRPVSALGCIPAMRAGNRTAPVAAGVLVWREEVSDDTICCGGNVGDGGDHPWSRPGKRGG